MITALILLGLGLFSVLLEFFLPGAIFAAIGALLILGSIVVFAMESDSLALTGGYIVAALIAFTLLVRFALWRIRRGAFGNTIYSDMDQEGFTASTWDPALKGKEGVVSSDLKPGGHVVVDGERYSAISQSGYIVKGEKIIVVGGEGESLIVKAL